MSMDEAKILQVAQAWALALTELEQMKPQGGDAGELTESAELAIYSAAARAEALKYVERALFQAVWQR